MLIRRGKDKGKTGKVILCIPDKLAVVVEGMNMQIKHVRPKKEGEKGQKIPFPKPLPIAAVSVVCSQCKKPSRIGIKILEDGQKARQCKKCKAEFK